MLVELTSLKPNPMRDFTVDPIDDEVVKKLRQSIEEDGFWGGVVCRKLNGGETQIAAGHHRVKAAIEAGVDRADVFVSRDMDDAGLIRIYARENATQRGNSGTAQAGTVASAIRFLAKALMTNSASLSKILDSDHAIAKARESLAGQAGLGQRVIVGFLDGVPGINDGAVQQQLANLKSSGNYARIIGEVQQEIEEENKEALKALEEAEREQERLTAERAAAEARQKEAEERRKEAVRVARAAKEEADRKRAEEQAKQAELDRQRAEEQAKLAKKREEESKKKTAEFDALRKTSDTARDTARKAASKASEREKTFDFEGVAKHLRNFNQIDVFREVVTGQGVAPFLPWNKQAALAAHLVKLAKDQGVELSGRFIRDHAAAMVLNVRSGKRSLDNKEKEELAKRDWDSKAKNYQADFARAARGMLAAAIKLSEHCRVRPKGVTLHATGEFSDAVKNAFKALKLIERM